MVPWHILRHSPTSLYFFQPSRHSLGRFRVRHMSILNTQDFTDLLGRVQEKAKELRDKAITNPFRWPPTSDPSQASVGEDDGLIAEAIKSNSLGFGFSAGGMLFPYYIGVVDGLRNLGLATEHTQIAGASAGSIIAVSHHSGLSTDVIGAACLELAEDCRQNGTRGRLGLVLEKFLYRLLPDDIHERCRGKAFVAVTRAFPRPKGELISEFESKDDLVKALLTSCHIPWWFDNSLTTTYRGSQCYDGGLTNFIPLPPVKAGIRVCCFPSKQISSVYNIQVSPDTFEDWPYGIEKMLMMAFEPASEEILVEFISKGRADAEAWALQSGAAAALKETSKAAAGLEQESYPALKS